MDAVRLVWVLPVAAISIIVIKNYTTTDSLKGKGKRHGLTLPPGPSRWQAIKDLLTMDDSQPWLLFSQWTKRYGGLTYADFPGQRVLFLDSENAIRELMENRSSKYSGRPEAPTMSLYGWGFTTSNLPYNDKWRQHRRFYQHGLHSEGVLKWRPFQLQSAHTLSLNLLNNPEHIIEHIVTFTASTIMAALYGYTTLPNDDPLLDIVLRAISIFVESTSTLNILIFSAFFRRLKIYGVEHFPAWLPGLKFYRNAATSRELAREMMDTPFEFVKQSITNGSAQPSMVYEILTKPLEDRESKLLDEQIIKEAAASGLSAGIETTSSSIIAFFLAMAMHPGVQERAQTEIDAVIGKGRLPNFDDRPALPYVEAVFRETVRWFQASPMGKCAPHATTDDDTYNGFFIPKKTTVFVNIWALAHDESKYRDPHTFDPSRFLTPEENLNDDNMQYVFGFGRRVCPGRYLAEASMWIAIATILSVFKIGKAKNEHGEDIEVALKFTPGQVMCVTPMHLYGSIK
ncbi:hypothetical protein Clacol_004803 [Clathrus columnatus]|uniref:Cytochrome P450 n=1 Tax=Clathrus columnatus TaxID=1419009 RepID=A0AAV5A7H3_9AGAM|nr:hypothetical protein Clacol_004803 [Clathrus columnatus]